MKKTLIITILFITAITLLTNFSMSFNPENVTVNINSTYDNEQIQNNSIVNISNRITSVMSIFSFIIFLPIIILMLGF